MCRVAAALVFVALSGGLPPAGADPTILLPQASASGFHVGAPIYDTVTVNGVNPTGSLTFRLYGPADPTCSGTPIFTSTKSVTGDGFYTSDSYTPTEAGTYRWIVAYSGDAANPPAETACNDSRQAVTVARRIPTLDVTATPLMPGRLIADVATLRNGQGPAGPTGTITFQLYGPNNLVCGGAPIFTSTVPVSGNGTYVSESFRPRAPGTYQWIATYSGDANNTPVQTICSDPAQTVRVRPPSVVSDFNGDGDTDTAVFRPLTNQWFIRDGRARVVAWGVMGDSPVPADYDGDGATDVAVFRPATSEWFIQQTQPRAVAWGVLGDIPVPADYDGDIAADVAVFRPVTGEWFIGGPLARAVAWGAPGDIPVPADYDGDGAADVAVFRPVTGQWFINTSPPRSLAWGRLGDIPVPADYDGDGVVDGAVFRPVTGQWFINTSPRRVVAWGTPGDLPVPGDYDGDGTVDEAVFRPLTGQWFITDSRRRALQWGAVGDIPMPLPAAVRQLGL
jgi:hypothetical protein